MSETTWRADPLHWGHGPRVFEVFLEPTCPFSARAFGKLDETLALAGPDKVTIKIRLQSQPWHLYSGVLTRLVIAASTLLAGKEAAKAALAAVAAHREEFEFTRHAGGPNMDATPNDIIGRLEGYSGLKLAEAFGAVGLRAAKTDDVDRVIKEMLAVDRPVIVDVAVDKLENCFPMIPSGAAHNEMLLGPEDKKASLIPAGWFDQWADATWATDPEGARMSPPLLRAPNGVVQDGLEFFGAGKPYYDPAKIRAPTLLVLAEWDRDTPTYMAQTLFPLLVNAPGKRMVTLAATIAHV